MPRTEQLITGDTPLAAFARDLRKLRPAELTYRQMSGQVHYSTSALSGAAGGKKVPTWDCVQAYLQACGVTAAAEIAQWKQRLEALRQEAERRRQLDRVLPERGTAVPIRRAVDKLETVTAGDIARAAGLPPPRSGQVKVETPSTAELGRISTMVDLVAALDRLRQARGLSIREVAEKSIATASAEAAMSALKKSTLGDVLAGRRKRIGSEFFQLYLRTCDVDADELNVWTSAWERVHYPNFDQLLARFMERFRRDLITTTTMMTTGVDELPAQPRSTPAAMEVNSIPSPADPPVPPPAAILPSMPAAARAATTSYMYELAKREQAARSDQSAAAAHRASPRHIYRRGAHRRPAAPEWLAAAAVLALLVPVLFIVLWLSMG